MKIKFSEWCILAFCLFVAYRMVFGYGGRWEFDDNFVPVTAMAPDGTHYRNGDEMDMVTMSIARSHAEGKAWLFFLTVYAVIAIWGICHFRRLKKKYEALNKRASMTQHGTDGTFPKP